MQIAMLTAGVPNQDVGARTRVRRLAQSISELGPVQLFASALHDDWQRREQWDTASIEPFARCVFSYEASSPHTSFKTLSEQLTHSDSASPFDLVILVDGTGWVTGIPRLRRARTIIDSPRPPSPRSTKLVALGELLGKPRETPPHALLSVADAMFVPTKESETALATWGATVRLVPDGIDFEQYSFIPLSERNRNRILWLSRSSDGSRARRHRLDTCRLRLSQRYRGIALDPWEPLSTDSLSLWGDASFLVIDPHHTTPEPHVVLHAMAAGVSVVGPEKCFGDLPVRPYESCLVAESDKELFDRIAWSRNNPTEHQQLLGRARVLAGRFSWARIGTETVEWLKSFTGNCHGR